jgi:uncharacterized flavoprotein (TIGR03862 family)
MSKKITIIGAGPSGLFCAYLLVKKGHTVHLYDQMSGVGKKFLVAGHGGLNLTHSESLDTFSGRYGRHHELFSTLLEDFSPKDLQKWCHDLGVETFIGSSGRVFPQTFKAADILKRWLDELKSHDNFHLHLRHKLVGISKDRDLIFQNESDEHVVKSDFMILALGGASWKKTGSDGKWAEILSSMGIQLADFQPMNCGFEIQWSDYIKQKIDHMPLKNIGLSFASQNELGEMMLTPYGVEGGAVYALSRELVDGLKKEEKVTLYLDLKPGLKMASVKDLLKQRKNKESLSNFLRKKFKLAPIAVTLIKECVSIDESDIDQLALSIKKLPLKLINTRPIDEAISTMGGVAMTDLTRNFELKLFPGFFIAGEMLDFEAPTGGYLLQGCFSTSWRVAQHILKTC